MPFLCLFSPFLTAFFHTPPLLPLPCSFHVIVTAIFSISPLRCARVSVFLFYSFSIHHRSNLRLPCAFCPVAYHNLSPVPYLLCLYPAFCRDLYLCHDPCFYHCLYLSCFAHLHSGKK